MRKRIYEMIEVAADGDKISRVYDFLMILTILVSLIPLALKNPGFGWEIVDKVCVTIFIIDYFMRLCTADFKGGEGKKGVAFLKYPFTPMAIIDLLSILPSLLAFHPGLKILRVFRMLRAFRVFRVFRTLRYSKSMRIMVKVWRASKSSLIAVGTLSIGYILVSALVVFNVEPTSFTSYFDAVYWGTVSLTTVGYGDIYPVSTAGRVITMVSSIFGIAIVALPTGIITAGYMAELEKENEHETSKGSETDN